MHQPELLKFAILSIISLGAVWRSRQRQLLTKFNCPLISQEVAYEKQIVVVSSRSIDFFVSV